MKKINEELFEQLEEFLTAANEVSELAEEKDNADLAFLDVQIRNGLLASINRNTALMRSLKTALED